MTGCCAKSAGVCPETKEGCCPASKTPETCTSPSNGKKSSQVWMQPIGLQGFAPNEVKVRVADGMVHIHAKAEKSSGPGPCLSRYEMRRTVKLPEDVDQRSVSCVMTPNGSVLLYAPRPALEEKKGKGDAVTHQLGEKTEEGKEKEETSALSADSQHSEAAELKPESATEKKDVTSNKTDFAKLAETPFTMMDSNPATEGKNTIPEHAETTPKSLTEMASEVLGMSEKTEHAHSAEEQEKEKMEAANVSPKAEEHDSEESEGSLLFRSRERIEDAGD
nr:hypothetical protein BaRGS_001336 [Batillaria attramentaria]